MTPREIYLQVWKSAFERGKIELRYPTHKEAVRMRLNLYTAVKGFRHVDTDDPEMASIVLALEMVIQPEKDETFTLLIRLKTLNPLLIEASRHLDALKEAE